LDAEEEAAAAAELAKEEEQGPMLCSQLSSFVLVFTRCQKKFVKIFGKFSNCYKYFVTIGVFYPFLQYLLCFL
jgi:hypothetical protein